MNRDEWLKQFKKNLINISDMEREDAVRYYTEYFDDAGAENEQKVIEELGNPVMLARKISAQAAIRELSKDKSHDGIGRNHFTIILLLCSFPVWLPLAIVAAVTVFVLILTAFIFVFCAVAAGAALALGGAFGFLVGIVSLFTHFINGITVIGAGMFMAGVGLVLFIAGKYLIKGMVALIVALGKRKTGGI